MSHALQQLDATCSMPVTADSAFEMLGLLGVANVKVMVSLFPESACEGFFVKKQQLYYIFTPSHLQI